MNIYYVVETVEASVIFGLAAKVNTDVGFNLSSISALEKGYGSPILVLPTKPPDTSSSYAIDVITSSYFSDAFQIHPNGTPNIVWIPNINLSAYTQPYGFRGGNSDEYFSPNSVGDPQFYIGTFPNHEYSSRVIRWIKKTRYRYTVVSFASQDKPNYMSLLNGYQLDTRVKPSAPIIVAPVTAKVTIGYYRENELEQTNYRSIDWLTYDVDLSIGKSITLPIIDPVLGTVSCSSQLVKQAILNTNQPSTEYNYSFYFNENLPQLFIEWTALWNNSESNAPNIPGGTYISNTSNEIARTLRCLSSNNNHWNNRPIPTSDLNVDLNHPMFTVNNIRAYDWHVKPQTDSSYGDLIMDSPRTIEINAALNAGIWANNPDDPDLPRVDNLGWRVNRLCEVNGIRVKPDGKIDETKEKKENRREHAEGKQKNDPQEYNPNCFGSKGLLVRYLPNKFKPKGKDVETIEGGFRKVKDIPQLLAELHEQANAAMGYQEGTAIEITVDDETYRYPNQLALLTEIFVTLKQSGAYSKGAFFSSVVAEQSIKEVIGGLGLRTVDKYLEFKIAGKTAKLYYKGISASQSIRRKLSAISTNIGTIIGNIT